MPAAGMVTKKRHGRFFLQAVEKVAFATFSSLSSFGLFVPHSQPKLQGYPCYARVFARAAHVAAHD